MKLRIIPTSEGYFDAITTLEVLEKRQIHPQIKELYFTLLNKKNMKKLLNKILNPKYFLILLILFSLSIFILQGFMDYMYANKMINISIVLFYFIPLLLFFTISSIYNFIKFKNSKGNIKIIVLIPLSTQT